MHAFSLEELVTGNNLENSDLKHTYNLLYLYKGSKRNVCDEKKQYLP